MGILIFSSPGRQGDRVELWHWQVPHRSLDGGSKTFGKIDRNPRKSLGKSAKTMEIIGKSLGNHWENPSKPRKSDGNFWRISVAWGKSLEQSLRCSLYNSFFYGFLWTVLIITNPVVFNGVYLEWVINPHFELRRPPTESARSYTSGRIFMDEDVRRNHACVLTQTKLASSTAVFTCKALANSCTKISKQRFPTLQVKTSTPWLRENHRTKYGILALQSLMEPEGLSSAGPPSSSSPSATLKRSLKGWSTATCPWGKSSPTCGRVGGQLASSSSSSPSAMGVSSTTFASIFRRFLITDCHSISWIKSHQSPGSPAKMMQKAAGCYRFFMDTHPPSWRHHLRSSSSRSGSPSGVRKTPWVRVSARNPMVKDMGMTGMGRTLGSPKKSLRRGERKPASHLHPFTFDPETF